MSVIGSFLSSTLPSWTCFLDGNELISNTISQVDPNNVEICSSKNIVAKKTPSDLTVVANSPFLLDRIQYAPDSKTTLDDATLVVDAFDSKIKYDSEWNTFGTTGMQTSVQGASMTFDFVGALPRSFKYFL